MSWVGSDALPQPIVEWLLPAVAAGVFERIRDVRLDRAVSARPAIAQYFSPSGGNGPAQFGDARRQRPMLGKIARDALALTERRTQR
ncbi:hypothetical protein [Cryobacterium lyxosi]|uniref:Uncharacterized protein n=1 Tax=Cryobacterium lyxosi TaxID=1259228 RepID=A0A4R8ZFY7_9MICO|nr:hypothetical protein [Cryobacterium lyxosi]TFD26031.1 hypothetical protein E3T27_09615 [Cryobacterium lyxosi]